MLTHVAVSFPCGSTTLVDSCHGACALAKSSPQVFHAGSKSFASCSSLSESCEWVGHSPRVSPIRSYVTVGISSSNSSFSFVSETISSRVPIFVQQEALVPIEEPMGQQSSLILLYVLPGTWKSVPNECYLFFLE